MKNTLRMLLVICLFISVTNYAQPMKGKGGMSHQRDIKSTLKLTPEQEKQFDDITYKQKQAAIDIKAKIQKNRLDFKKMINDKNVDESKILQLTDDNSKLQAELKRGSVKRWIDIYKILNADQKEIFLKGLDKLTDRNMMRGKMGKHMMKECEMGSCFTADKDMKN